MGRIKRKMFFSLRAGKMGSSEREVFGSHDRSESNCSLPSAWPDLPRSPTLHIFLCVVRSLKDCCEFPFVFVFARLSYFVRGLSIVVRQFYVWLCYNSGQAPASAWHGSQLSVRILLNG